MKSLRGPLLMVCGLLLAGSTYAQTVSFQAAVNYLSAPGGATSVAVADFDGDGKLDLAVANLNGASVSILLGNGDGTFRSATTFGAGIGPSSVVVGDFNRDGKLDLAVANLDGGNVSVLLGNGDGSFQTATTFAGDTAPSSLVVGDVNGDLNPDLELTDSLSNDVVVLLGNGGGVFHEAAHPWFAGTNPVSIATGDFNGDGNLDLAVANSGSNDVSVLLGDGVGIFSPPANYAAGSNPRSVAVGDLNGDGKLDLAVANSSSNDVSVLLGNGDGTFQSAVSYQTGQGCIAVVISDFDGDGKRDLATANFNDGNVSVLIGNGNGTFQSPQNFAVGTNSVSLAAEDFNGDGKPDLAVTQSNTGNVAILLNTTGIVSASATALVSSINPSVFNQYTVLTATVTSTSRVPTGTVTFSDNGIALGMQTLTSGAASLSVFFSSVGSHPLTATYGGDASHTGSTSPVLIQVVNKEISSTSIVSSPNPSLVAQQVVFTALVIDPVNGQPASGTVTFLDGVNTLGTATLSGGQASLTLAFTAPGTHTITGIYSGDANYLSSTSGPLSQVVNGTATTTTMLTSSLNPSVYGQSVTFTAKVTSAIGAPPNGETVTFQDGIFSLGTAALNGGIATFATSALFAFTHSITATYAGDANFTASSSPALSQVVSKAGTTTILVSTANPSIKGKSVTFTATVTGQFGGAPAGVATFKDGSQLIGVAILLNGKATFSTSSLAKGSHLITVTYSGLINFSGSSGALTQVVN